MGFVLGYLICRSGDEGGGRGAAIAILLLIAGCVAAVAWEHATLDGPGQGWGAIGVLLIEIDTAAAGLGLLFSLPLSIRAPAPSPPSAETPRDE